MKIIYSVIIPVKNEGTDIIKCLQNLSISNYSKYNTEIILVDDSNQKNKKILKEYIQKNNPNNLRYYENLNLGLSGSCNYGVSQSIGEYLIFINADNLVNKNFFNNLNKEINSDNEIQIMSIQNFMIETESFFTKYLETLNRQRIMNNKYFNKLIDKNYISYTEGFVIKKNVFLKAGGFLESQSNSPLAGEDLVLAHNLAQLNNYGYLSGRVKLEHIVPSDFSQFYRHRYIRGYGVPQVAYNYFHKSKINIFFKTLSKVFLNLFLLMTFINPIITILQLSHYNKTKNIFIRFLFIYYIDKIILLYAEFKSAINIFFITQKNKGKYIKSDCIDTIFVTQNKFKFSSIRIACEKKYKDKLIIVDSANRFINSSTTEMLKLYIIIYKILFRIGIIYDYSNANSRLINLNRINKINTIILNKALFINHTTLQLIKKINPEVKIVFWSEDNMFISKHKTNSFMKSLKFFDYYYTLVRNENINNKIKKLIPKTLTTLPTITEDILNHNFEKKEVLSKITFIGYYDSKRINFLSYLSDNNITVHIYGNGWDKVNKKLYKNLIFHEPVYGKKYFEVINNSLININFLRNFTEDIINLKTIEILASGGFLLNEFNKYQRELLPNNTSFVYFDNKEDLLKKIKFFINNYDELIKIRNNAKKSLINLPIKTEHTFDRLLTL